MKTVISVLLALGTSALAASPGPSDFPAGVSQQNIYEIIRSHENRKYGDHGGHEYEEGEIDQKQASRKRYGYLPLDSKIKAPVYYDGLSSSDKTYRENVAAYATKPVPLHLSNALHQVPDSRSHYAIVDPITKNHQYVIIDAPKPKYDLKSSYILEEEPHYVVPDQNIVAKPSIPHYLPLVKDYSHSHLLDKSHHASGHGHYGDNSVHGESGHKNHKKHEISGHKSHSTSAGHHDEHDHHHNRAHYERDRGYHYEKAYAYDRIRAHHDILSDKGAHSDYRARHSHEGQKDSGSHGAHGHSHFRKQEKAGDYGLRYLSPHHHAHGK